MRRISMTSEQEIQVIVPVAVPIVTAIVGILVLQFQDWRARRSTDSARRRAIEEARQQTEFASAWLTANALLNASGNRIDHAEASGARWLESAASLATSAQNSLPED